MLQKAKYIYSLDSLLKVDNLPFKITIKMMAAIAKDAVRASSYESAAKVIHEHYKVKANVAIESANKYTMQNRIKLQGMRWNTETAQGVLSLKARIESDRWYEIESLISACFGK